VIVAQVPIINHLPQLAAVSKYSTLFFLNYSIQLNLIFYYSRKKACIAAEVAALFKSKN